MMIGIITFCNVSPAQKKTSIFFLKRLVRMIQTTFAVWKKRVYLISKNPVQKFSLDEPLETTCWKEVKTNVKEWKNRF